MISCLTIDKIHTLFIFVDKYHKMFYCEVNADILLLYIIKGYNNISLSAKKL